MKNHKFLVYFLLLPLFTGLKDQISNVLLKGAPSDIQPSDSLIDQEFGHDETNFVDLYSLEPGVSIILAGKPGPYNDL